METHTNRLPIEPDRNKTQMMFSMLRFLLTLQKYKKRNEH